MHNTMKLAGSHTHTMSIAHVTVLIQWTHWAIVISILQTIFKDVLRQADTASACILPWN